MSIGGSAPQKKARPNFHRLHDTIFEKMIKKDKKTAQPNREALADTSVMPYDSTTPKGNHLVIKNEISALIRDKRARVAVIGLGYVGLPLVTEFARAGLKAVGFEVDETKAAQIKAGRSYIGDVESSLVKELVDA